MLLYQMSQWMNERERLHRQLQGGGEEVFSIQQQIQELEERLYDQARQWLASYKVPGALSITEPAYEAPILTDPELGML